MKTNLLLTVLIFAQHSSLAGSPEYSLRDLWVKIQSYSPEISRETHLFNAATIAAHRANKHWLPSLGVSGQFFSTNDPGTNFISTLSQRQIAPADFGASALNQPGSHLFQRASIGIDFPIFEGGRKASEAGALEKLEEAAEAKKNASVLNAFLETTIAYTSLSSLQTAHARVTELTEKVRELISRYSIGGQSNPVGYSGMLGLQGLRNRAEGMAVSLRSKQDAYTSLLSQKARLASSDWQVKPENVNVILDRELPAPKNTAPSDSYAMKSARANSIALERMSDGEKARFLPKVGIFADESITRGSRDTGSSFTAGLYLQWSLFNPDHLGRKDQADELRLAAASDSENVRQDNLIEQTNLVLAEDAVKKNLNLLLDSEKLLSEQAKVATQLFRSGSISALQLVEVLNRRMDLIVSLQESEQKLIESRAKRISLTQNEGINL